MKKLIRITTVPLSLKILLKGQLKFMSSYFNVIGISSPGNDLEEVKKNESIDVISVKMTRQISPLTDLISLLKLIIILRKEKPEIVHTHTPKAGLIGMLAARITGVQVRMHTVAGLPLTVATGFKKKLLKLTEKITNACALKVYPNSYKLGEYILENKLCRKDKLKVIGEGSSNGIDLDFFKKNKQILQKAEEIKRKLKIPSDAFICLFIGRIVEDKGVNELVSAFSEIKSENTYLILVGDYENDLNPIKPETAEEINSNSKIIIPGFQKDVRPYLALADVFVFPSYREGFPNVVLQAGAMEVPAIVSDINGCNEIVEDEKNGLIVDAKNTEQLKTAMEKVLNNRELLGRIKTNCRENIILNYDRNYVWNKLLDEYNLLIKKNVQ